MRGIFTANHRQEFYLFRAEELGESTDACDRKEPRVLTTLFSIHFHCFRVFPFYSRCLPFFTWMYQSDQFEYRIYLCTYFY